MPASTVVKNFTDGLLTLKDGTATPITCDVKFDNGDFSISGLSQKLREVVAYQSRGVLNSVRHTARTFPTFTFTCKMSEFTSLTANSISDALTKKGAFLAGVSTLGASADVWSLDVVLKIEGTNFGDSADHTFTMEDCVMTFDFGEGDPSQFSISGTVYGAITGDIAPAV